MPAERKRRSRNQWQDRALCAGDPEPFFPPDGDDYDAKLICRCCEVRSECLDYALARNEFGIWGGLTERERKPQTARSLTPTEKRR